MNLSDYILIIVGTHTIVLILQFYFLRPRGFSTLGWQIDPDRIARRPFDDVVEGEEYMDYPSYHPHDPHQDDVLLGSLSLPEDAFEESPEKA